MPKRVELRDHEKRKRQDPAQSKVRSQTFTETWGLRVKGNIEVFSSFRFLPLHPGITLHKCPTGHLLMGGSQASLELR